MTELRKKPILGLIGSIGAGKSAAAAALATRGGYVVDCDRLGHVALDDPRVQPQVLKLWGPQVLNPDGSANRRAIASIVFDSPEERRALEDVVFPVIAELTRGEIDRANADPRARFVVLDAATLLEAGWANKCDRILYVDAPRELRLERLRGRSGWNDDELSRRESAQLNADRKRSAAHATVLNAGSRADLQAQLDATLAEWQWLPRTPETSSTWPEERR